MKQKTTIKSILKSNTTTPDKAVSEIMDSLQSGSLDGWSWNGQRLDDHTAPDGSWHSVGRMSLSAATEHVMIAAGLREWREDEYGCCISHPAYDALFAR